MFKQIRFRMIAIFLAGLLIIFFTGAAHAAKIKTGREDSPAVMTEAELQSQVMAFADRFVSIITAAFNAYEAQEPPPEDYKSVFSIVAYSMSSAFTIAAESNPAGALLDMISMVTLGRIIFEENMQEKFGPQLRPVIEGYRKAEKDIWQVSAKILNSAQQQELYQLIHKWRRSNPEIIFFPSVRFSDFSALRGDSDLEEKKSGGLFKSVENATQQVEEVRLLAERGMYLATRMPMLTGVFAGVWFSQLAKHPDMEKILKDVNKFSEVSERLATVAEQLPDQIAIERDRTIKQAMENITELTMTTMDETTKKAMAMIDATVKKLSLERKAAIRQLMDEFSAERKRTIEDFLNEDQRMRGLLSEVRLTLAEGNKLIGSADSLVKGLNLGPSEAKAATPAKPFDIKDYQVTLKEASNTILQLHGLVRTIDQMGLEKALPQIITAIETVEKRGEKWVFFAFILGIALIVVFLVGGVIALLTYRHFADRISKSKLQQAKS
ncbi:MAG: hypothetical protein KAV87_59290 [Desulfobacteraceae bacterium]|nr:hypothetical protein [Desulfobacteraceae bacterium]